MTADAKSEMEKAATECAKEVCKHDIVADDSDYVHGGFVSGTLWLLAELEKAFAYEIASVETCEEFNRLFEVIEKARELCGK